MLYNNALGIIQYVIISLIITNSEGSVWGTIHINVQMLLLWIWNPWRGVHLRCLFSMDRRSLQYRCFVIVSKVSGFYIFHFLCNMVCCIFCVLSVNIKKTNGRGYYQLHSFKRTMCHWLINLKEWDKLLKIVEPCHRLVTEKHTALSW